MRKSFFGLLAVGLLAGVGAGMSGCGGEEGFAKIEVPVTVTKGGVPLADCIVTFYPYDDPTAPPSGKAVAEMAMTQKTDADGKGLVKIAKGKYRVAFRSNAETTVEDGADTSEKMKGVAVSGTQPKQGEAPSMAQKDAPSNIDPKYNNPESTGFEPFDVNDSHKEKGLEFDLKG